MLDLLFNPVPGRNHILVDFNHQKIIMNCGGMYLLFD